MDNTDLLHYIDNVVLKPVTSALFKIEKDNKISYMKGISHNTYNLTARDLECMKKTDAFLLENVNDFSKVKYQYNNYKVINSESFVSIYGYHHNKKIVWIDDILDDYWNTILCNLIEDILKYKPPFYENIKFMSDEYNILLLKENNAYAKKLTNNQRIIYYYFIIMYRNRAWMKHILSNMEDSSCFIVCGICHCNDLINKLENSGYNITPVKNDDNLYFPKNTIDDILFH